MKTKTLIILVFVMVISILVGAQENQKFFLGIQPAITKEKFYEEKEFDVNILPLLVEIPVSRRVNLRFTSLLNYHVGGKSKISDVGIFVLTPIFLKKQTSSKSSGFYVAPVVGFGTNKLNNHTTTTLAIEPGYMFPAKKSFTISLGIQYGGSYFSSKHVENNWVEHFGVKVNFGFWL